MRSTTSIGPDFTSASRTNSVTSVLTRSKATRTAGPVYSVVPHTSSDGIAWISNPDWPDEYRTLYSALFGEVFNPTPVGHIVEGVHLREITTPDGYTTYRGEPFDFVTELDRPLPLTVDLAGDMLVGDYATGLIYAIRYAGEE